MVVQRKKINKEKIFIKDDSAKWQHESNLLYGNLVDMVTVAAEVKLRDSMHYS